MRRERAMPQAFSEGLLRRRASYHARNRTKIFISMTYTHRAMAAAMKAIIYDIIIFADAPRYWRAISDSFADDEEWRMRLKADRFKEMTACCCLNSDTAEPLLASDILVISAPSCRYLDIGHQAKYVHFACRAVLSLCFC